ncbi:HupE/UreJ family protein [Methylobacterium planeticum]|uniref:HupE/UreJ family protein n=1 Tax=Methylobacterium planeticum TaxID=2615211 RepID=A0A6N6MTU4_9HYPH|nr:HupE/UreJ family protein [Methylobacterium planeticum]KAB1074409.1 HupE/UreJ family protein [Methylobacterium planeticum]
MPTPSPSSTARRLNPVTGILGLALLTPGAALAHPGHGEALGLAAGLAHPLAGLDHVAAMVAVGLIAALRGGRALWLLPLVFPAMMALGAGAGMAGLALPFAEVGILASLVAFGLLAILGRGLPVALLAALLGAFAVFHGYAHGVEMPETASGLAYGLGFLAATGLLHLAGLGLGLLIGRARGLNPGIGSGAARS